MTIDIDFALPVIFGFSHFFKQKQSSKTPLSDFRKFGNNLLQEEYFPQENNSKKLQIMRFLKVTMKTKSSQTTQLPIIEIARKMRR